MPARFPPPPRPAAPEGGDPDEEDGERGPGVRVGEFEVWSDSYRGSQGCPFFLDGEVGDLSSDDTCGDTDRDWIIRNTALDEEIFISGLIVHLLRHHRFCEGHVKYRLDPGRAVRVLGIRRAEGGAAR